MALENIHLGDNHRYMVWPPCEINIRVGVRTMDRDFIYRQVLVWLAMEIQIGLTIPIVPNERERLAESLTNHLCNNWEMVELAKEMACTKAYG